MTTSPPPPGTVTVWRRLAGLLRALAALTVLAGCLVGAPLLMWRLIGWPLPHHLPSRGEVSAVLTSPLDQRLVTGILGCLFWYVYLLLAVSALTDAVALATGRRRPRLPTATLPQTLTTALIGTILTGLILAAGRSKPVPASGHTAALAAYRTPTVATAPAHPHPTAAPSRPVHADLPRSTVPVLPHDSLWKLAATHLGDPLRYQELFTLNQDRLQPDGDRLTRPDLIRPGWTLLLPADAVTPAAPAPHDPPPPDTHPAGPPTPATSAPTVTPWLPTIPATPPAPPSPASAPAVHPQPEQGRPDPIRLPSGPVLPASLLAAVTIAVTVARLLRHRTRPAGSRPDNPADPPLPLIIREILRSSRTLDDTDTEDNPFGGRPQSDDHDGDENGEEPPPTGDARPPQPAAAWQPQPTPDTSPVAPAAPMTPAAPRRASAVLRPPPAAPTATASIPAPRPPRPGLDGPAAPTRLPAALRTGGISLPEPSGDAARALILTALAAHHTPAGDDPHHLIITRDAATDLRLPEQLLTRLPHVTLTPTGADALACAERHLLTRTRLTTDHTTTTISQLRAAAPDEHLPTVLLVLAADPPLLPRLNALADHGAALDILTAALGPWPGRPPWPDLHDPAWALPPAAAADLLQLLNDATPRDPTPPVDTAVPPTGASRPHAAADTHAHPSTEPQPDPDPPSPDPTPLEPVSVEPREPSIAPSPPPPSAARDDTEPAAPTTPTVAEAPDGDDGRAQPTPVSAGPEQVRLILLDRPQLRRAGSTVYQGRLSLEIAGYLALHRGGATTTTLLGALLPDVDPDRAKDQIYQAIRRLREALRHAGADHVLLSDRNGYRLTDTITCDLWDVERALTTADQTTDDQTRTTALRTATRLYTGRLLDGCEWATAHATHLEHRLTDAAADLADLLADDDPTTAAGVLEHAITLTPYTESLYTHLMRLHAAAGHRGDIHRVYRRLLTRLADLGTTPSPDTDRLLARLTRPHHQPPSPA